jgi:hypothetical protein
MKKSGVGGSACPFLHAAKRAGATAYPTLFLLAVSAHAAAPLIQDISPHGAQRGKTFTLYLRGEGLALSAQVKTTLPGTFSRLTRSKAPPSAEAKTYPSVLPFLVNIPADAPTDFYPIRVITPDGISNVVLFSVGDFPEIEEADAPAQAQRITVPVTINGKLESNVAGGAVDIDNYVFHAKAGQNLIFEVEARRAGSAIDPAIEIFDSAGGLIAKNDDAPGLGVDSRLDVTFPKAGDYRLQIHDSKYSIQAVNFYRLRIGKWNYAEGMFPLGWKRGETADVTFSGGNLKQPVHVAAGGPIRTFSPALPTPFALSDGPEELEPATLPAPLHENTVMNGRISKAHEIDRYQLAVEPGQNWVFELSAASLGTSQLDGLLTIYDAAGKKLTHGDQGSGLDPVLSFTVPKDIHEISIAVEDLLGRGGDAYAYRLQARRQLPDFIAELLTPYVNVPAGGTAQVNVQVQRRGYVGDIRLKIPNLPPGVTVSGGHIPSEAAAQNFNNDNAGRRTARSTLTLVAAPDTHFDPTELSVWAEATTPDGIMRRQAVGPGLVTAVRGDRQRAFTAPWLGIQLPIAAAPPSPLTVVSSTPIVRIAQGVEYNIDYAVKRDSNMKAPAKVNLNIAGAVGNLRILKGEKSASADKGAYALNTNFATPVTTFDILLEADTEIEGKPARISAPAIEIQIVPGYEVTLDQNNIQVRPGEITQVTGKVRREPTFEGAAVRVQIEDLPDGVSCPQVEVPIDKKEFSVACSASASAKAGASEVRVTSMAPETGRKTKQDYKIADINAKITIAQAAPAHEVAKK